MSTARKWMVAALVAVVAGSFAVSASSTLALGSDNNMHGLPQLALVLVLEVASVTGTAIYVATRVRRVRIKAAVVVVGATGVALVGGLSTYSMLGVVAPLMMVFLVELIADFWHVATKTTETTETTSVQPEPPQWSGPETVELPRMPDTVPAEVEPEPAPRRLEPVGWSVDQIVADLLERGETDVDRRGFQRFVRDTYSVGASKYHQVKDRLQSEAVAS